MFGGGEPIAISSAKGDWDMVSSFGIHCFGQTNNESYLHIP